MPITLDLRFSFSACFDSEDGELISHNYTLSAWFPEMPLTEEKRVRRDIQRWIVDPIGSRDLGDLRDFFKNKIQNERQFLKELSQLIREKISSYPLLCLRLERGDRSALVMELS